MATRRVTSGQARNRHTSTSNPDRWMISYVDIVTILLILFISIAVQASQKPPPLPPPPKAAVPSAPPPPPAPKPQALTEAQAALQERGIEPKFDARGLVITLPQAVLFASGDDTILPEALPIIEKVADVLGAMDNRILLVGHADIVPVHNKFFRSNWELAAARSIHLLNTLTGNFGLPESRFTIASDGSNSPTSPNDDEDGRARNRRVEIVILDAAPRQNL
jgi:chemotaxis protein MotB